MSASIPREGDVAPAFELADDQGRVWRLADLRGKTVVLFFYPADDTPGCTAEACGFRDEYAAFAGRDAVLFGVSPDDAASHQAFRAKHGLPFPLLVDEGHRVAEAYGTWGPRTFGGKTFETTLRSTFVIGPDGRLARIFRDVKPQGHAREVLEALPR